MTAYVGRFAPSPSGLLHAGSLVAALASWLDARANEGRWLVRIEDLDGPRNVAGAAEAILDALARCGLVADAVPVLQSARTGLYEQALERLKASGRAYPCGCSRRDLELAAAPESGRARHAERVYPGTCRSGLNGKAARSFRLRTDRADSGAASGRSEPIVWIDRRLGPRVEELAASVGDFVLRRADGVWAYQLAVVVDDAAMGITEVVRGDDLVPSTPRQLLLYRALGWQAPRFAHVPLVVGPDGRRLAKRHGDTRLATLREAGTKAESLLGLLAWSCGWLPKPEPVTSRELLPLFRLESIPREPFVFTNLEFS